MSIAAEDLSIAHAAVETELSDWRDEVSLDQLSAGDRILVTTCHHAYEIVVALPATAEVLVRVHLAGSLVGGGALKMRSVWSARDSN